MGKNSIPNKDQNDNPVNAFFGKGIDLERDVCMSSGQ